MKKLITLFALVFSIQMGAQNALSFDGADDYVTTSYPCIMGGSTPITVEAWINSRSRNGEQVIAAWGSESVSGGRFTFRLQNVGGTADVIRIENKGGGINGTINVGDSTWHHVAVVYDPSATNKYALYVDGVLDVQNNISTPLNIQSGFNLQIGKRLSPTLGGYFDGLIEEVRVWDVARSLTQLIADSATEFCQPQTGLVAYHRFNSGTAGGTNTNDTISYDDSGLSNNGQLHGFALSGNTSNWVAGKLTPCVPPSCLSPTGLGSTNVLGTTADIYWTQNNTGSTVKLEYGISGFTLGQGTKLTPANDTISLTSLSGNTSYDVYVKEICSATDSSAWTLLSFTTGCTLINAFPYLESFDSTSVWVSGTGGINTGSVIDQCWSRNPSSGSYVYMWGTRTGTTSNANTGPTTDYSGTGNYIFVESSYGSTGALADFTSPTFDLSSLTVPELTFRYHMYGSSIGTLMVWAWNGSSYDTVWTKSGDKGNVWNEAIVDLSAYKTAYTHLVFHSIKTSSSSLGDIAIDQVSIAEAPPCPRPGSFSIDNITSSSARLNFVSNGTSFNVEYGPTGFSQGTGSTSVISSSGQTVSGLSSNMVYDFYIQNDCSGSSNGQSNWVGPITIHTLCGYTNMYFTNWDQLANNTEDFCWTFLAYGATTAYAKTYDPPASTALQPYSGTNYYRVNNSGSAINYLISPEFSDLDQSTLQVRFQAADSYTSTSGTPSFIIGTMASLSDTGSFVAVDTIETPTNSWTEFTILLNNVPTGHKHVVIRHGNNAGYVYMGIDDLYIEPIPACLPPSAGAFSEIKDTSVVLSWLPGDASVWEIEYGVAGYTQGSGTLITGVTDTLDTISGLTPQTCYDFYVRGNCTSNNSPWYGPVTICTECAIQVAPYLENFDGSTWVVGTGTTNQINTCWSRTPSSTYTFRWESNSNGTSSLNTGPSADASGAGKYVFVESGYGTTGTSAVLETPQVEFSALTTPTLSFAYHMYGATTGNIHVLVSNGSQFDTIHVINGEQQQSSSDPWKRAYIDLSAYTSSPRKFQFIAERGSSYTGDMAIDEVSVDEMPTCLLPDNFALDSVYSTFADFSWTSITNGTSFKMEYGPTGFSQASGTGNIVRTNGSPTRVSGLTPNMSYDIYLTDSCDSTSWVGPITFTTLIGEDAELQTLISPANLVCGDSSYAVEVSVKNNGVNTITLMGVGANITGAITTSLTNVYSGTIAPGASATITVGTINTYAGGIINIKAFTAYVGDQVTTNDTLAIDSIELISAQPQVYPIDPLCANDSIGEFAAVSQTGILHNWYQNMADVTPFATGDTVDVLPNQTLYLDRSKTTDQFIFDATPSSSQYGNMFKLYIKQDFNFTGFSFEPAGNGDIEPIAFYKQGDFVGHEATRSDWTPIDSLLIPNATNDVWYKLNFTTPVQFNAGDTISIYIANKQSTKMRWQPLNSHNSGDLYLANDDFEYYAGTTGAYFGSNMANPTVAKVVSSILHYSSADVCGNSRIALTMGVNNDTAVASFSHVVHANGADVDFDASASAGHVYDWDFGDGQSGTGINASNTYASAGSYTVTLTVTDTVCGTTDSVSQTVLANVGLSDLVLGKNISVYPNPNNGTFKVDLNLNGGHDVQLMLVNTVGQIVYTKDLGNIGGRSETELSIDNLAPGIYYLNVLASGKSTAVKITVFN